MTDMHDRIRDSFAGQGLMKTLGAELVSVGEGVVEIAMPYSKAIAQQHGYAHAGALASVVDSACGYAALTLAPPDCEVVSAEFKINLMRPGKGDRFLAVGRVESAGRRLTVCTGEARALQDGQWKTVAIMQATMVVVGPD